MSLALDARRLAMLEAMGITLWVPEAVAPAAPVPTAQATRSTLKPAPHAAAPRPAVAGTAPSLPQSQSPQSQSAPAGPRPARPVPAPRGAPAPPPPPAPPAPPPTAPIATAVSITAVAVVRMGADAGEAEAVPQRQIGKRGGMMRQQQRERACTATQRGAEAAGRDEGHREIHRCFDLEDFGACTCGSAGCDAHALCRRRSEWAHDEPVPPRC